MAENQEKKKLVLDLFKTKSAEELSMTLADVESQAEVGTAAALSAANAFALALRAARLVESVHGSGERLDYLTRNLENLRSYMLQLMDEDKRCRAPYRRAVRDNDTDRLEAALQASCAIANEIVCMVGNLLELLGELVTLCETESAVYVGAAARLGLSAAESCRFYLLGRAERSQDKTFRFVTRRENELTRSQLRAKAESICLDAEKCVLS